MLSELGNNLLVTPLFNILLILDKYTGSLGIAIILLTLLIRFALLPIVAPSMKTMKRQRELQPEIDKIKQKYKHDKKKQSEMQMELLKEHGINPLAGCLPQIPMLIILISLFTVFRKIAGDISLEQINSLIYWDSIKLTSLDALNTKFLWLNLTQKDPFFILAILAGALQFVNSLMMKPYVEAGEKAAKKTPDKTDDIAYNMQEQMLYILPIMTLGFSLSLSSGIVLYIVTTTVFSIVQTYYLSGLGALRPYVNKFNKLAQK